MKNINKISDTSFSPIISIGTPNESGFYETSAPKDNLSELIKNDAVLVEDDFYEVPAADVEVLEVIPDIVISDEKKD